jgi:hypothetical protein
MAEIRRLPRFLGLALKSGPRRYKGAQVAVDRGLASGKADFYDVTDNQLLCFIEEASGYLRQKAERADA